LAGLTDDWASGLGLIASNEGATANQPRLADVATLQIE
jgi:hypothetical protein